MMNSTITEFTTFYIPPMIGKILIHPLEADDQANRSERLRHKLKKINILPLRRHLRFQTIQVRPDASFGSDCVSDHLFPYAVATDDDGYDDDAAVAVVGGDDVPIV